MQSMGLENLYASQALREVKLRTGIVSTYKIAKRAGSMIGKSSYIHIYCRCGYLTSRL